MKMNSHIVIGTSGHVDHGKTAFIKHLTGFETDRLRDEQERGITIENGYAHLNLSNGLTVGFVDVPGHERFIKTMLAGAMGIDAVILIVAADEGIKAQTIEHFNIIKHLNIIRGFVLITKCDLVDEMRLMTVENEIKAMTQHSAFENKPLIHYSIYDSDSNQSVLAEIETIARDEVNKDVFVASRLNVDRIFSVKGFGTVVTGTLLEGSISKGDTLYLYPGEKKCRVKGVQVYGKTVESAQYGQRTALNVSLNLDDVHKGDTLTSIEAFKGTMIVDVRLKTDAIDEEIKHWQRLKLYHGTREILCRIVTKSIGSFEEKLVQLRLESPIYCKSGDPIIIRSYSPMVTLGGGYIISPYAKKHTHLNETDAPILQTASLLEALSHEAFIFTFSDLIFEKSSFSLEMGRSLFEQLIEMDEVHDIGDHKYLLAKNWTAIVDIIIDEVSKEHKLYPLRIGIQKETLRSKITTRLSHANIGKQDFGRVIQEMVSQGVLEERPQTIALNNYQVHYSPLEKSIVSRLLSHIEAHQQGVIPIDDLVNQEFNKIIAKEVLYHLINSEILVKINDENIMEANHYRSCKQALLKHFESHATISVAQFRDLTELSRKATVILLEHFDRILITKRNENTRTLIKS
jgi:selenocysteine-specific elongation factor